MVKEATADVVIIGAGVCGCAIARELSRYKLSCVVLEAREDVCCGTTKANSAIVHAGFDAALGTLKAKFNVAGNALFESYSKDLNFGFSAIGSLVLATTQKDISKLYDLYERGQQNGVPDLRILDKDALLSLEPHLTQSAQAALFAPTGGICDPFDLCIALFENAKANGISFNFNQYVKAISRKDDGWLVQTQTQNWQAPVIINAAGVFADTLHNMVSKNKISITARRGEYELLDTHVGDFVRHTIFGLPSKYGKGVLVTPTIHGNLLVGPTAVDVEAKDDTATTALGLSEVHKKAAQLVSGLDWRETITSFAGLRAHEAGDDFIIGEPSDAPGFIDCAGIESPGLTASLAIGVHIAELVAHRLDLAPNSHFNPLRKAPPSRKNMSFEEYQALVAQEPAYGRMVCRCNQVTEGEIIDAIKRGATTLDGVHKRTFALLGRCQGSFCTARIMELISTYAKLPPEDISKGVFGSNLCLGHTKDTWKNVHVPQDYGDVAVYSKEEASC